MSPRILLHDLHDCSYFDLHFPLYMFTAPVGWAVGLGVGESIEAGDAGAPDAGGVAALVGTETDGSSDDVDVAPGLAVSEGTGAAAIREVPAP